MEVQKEKEWQNKTAEILLNLNCFLLRPQDPFTYASGLLGPIYCDNRLLLSFVEEREIILKYFVSLIHEKIVAYDVVAGVATAGIPYAAWIAAAFSKPLIYVRSAAKAHGKGSAIEGLYKKNQRVIIIEDLINQGKSSGLCIETLANEGLRPLGLFSIVDYQMKAAMQEFSARNCPFYSLTNLSALVKTAYNRQLISEEEKKIIWEWHQFVNS